MSKSQFEQLLTFAEALEHGLTGPDAAEWLARTDAQVEDLRSALQHLIQQHDAERALRLAAALWRYWDQRRDPAHGRRWLQSAFAVEGEVSPVVKAKGLKALGNLLVSEGDENVGQSCWMESLALYRAAGDWDGTGTVLSNLGNLASRQGDDEAARALLEEGRSYYQRLAPDHDVGHLRLLRNLAFIYFKHGELERAREYCEDMLTICRRQGDPGTTADVLLMLAAAAGMGDRQAGTYYTEALRLARESGDDARIAVALNDYGNFLQYHGDFAHALPLLGESLALRRQFQDQSGIATALVNLGIALTRCDENDRAEPILAEAMAYCRRLGDQEGLAKVLDNMGDIAAAMGKHDQAVQLLEESLAISRTRDDRRDIAHSRNSLGLVQLAQGKRTMARASFSEALALYTALGESSNTALVRKNLRLLDRSDERAPGGDRSQEVSAVGQQDRRQELLQLGQQPEAWPKATDGDVSMAAFLQCFDAGAGGDLESARAAMPRIAPLFHYLPTRLSDDARLQILKAVIGGVEQAPDNRSQGVPLLPFLLFEPQMHLSSSAAIAFADHAELIDGDPLTGPRLLVDVARRARSQATAAGVCAGLLLMGDRRTISLVRDVLPLLDHASRVQLLMSN